MLIRRIKIKTVIIIPLYSSNVGKNKNDNEKILIVKPPKNRNSNSSNDSKNDHIVEK